VLVATALGAAAGALSCGPGRSVAERVVEAYVEAAQAGNADALYCLSASAAGAPDLGDTPAVRRETFAAWARAELDAYLDGRAAGQVDLDRSPIVLVKALTLGKGTYYRIESAVPVADEAAAVDMDVRLAYESIDLAGLSPGTGFFVCGPPPGAITHVVVPRFGGEITLDVLDRVPVRWTLVREPAADGCPEGWKVHSATVDRAGVTVRTVTWVFR